MSCFIFLNKGNRSWCFLLSFSCNLFSESSVRQQEPHPIHPHLNASLHRWRLICSLIEINWWAQLHMALHRDAVQCGQILREIKIKIHHNLSQSCDRIYSLRTKYYIFNNYYSLYICFTIWVHMSRPRLCSNLSIQIEFNPG